MSWAGGFSVYQQVEWNPDPLSTNWQFVVGVLAPIPPTNQWDVTGYPDGIFRIRPIR